MNQKKIKTLQVRNTNGKLDYINIINIYDSEGKKLENSFLEDPDSTVIIVTHHLYEENKHKFDQIIYLP